MYLCGYIHFVRMNAYKYSDKYSLNREFRGFYAITKSLKTGIPEITMN